MRIPMMISLLLLSGVALPASIVRALEPAHLWSLNTGASSSSITPDDCVVGVDGAGNVFLATSFTGTIDLGGGPLVSAGDLDIALAKFSATGAHLWSRRAGGTGTDRVLGITVSVTEDVWITGMYTGSADFGDAAPFPSAGGSDAFVIRYRGSDGAFQSGLKLGGTQADAGFALAVEPSGHIVVAGTFSGTVVSTQVWVSNGGTDVFIARFSPSPALLWSRLAGGPEDDVVYDIALDALGNIAATGVFRQSVDFGGGLLTSAGVGDAFIAMYSNANSHLWSRHYGHVQENASRSVAIDNAGNVFSAGYYDADDTFLLTHAPDGTPGWSRGYAALAGGASGTGVVTDDTGHILVTGNVTGPGDFGGGALGVGGPINAFLVKYAPDGALRWGQVYGSECRGHAIGIHRELGRPTVAGVFSGAADFGGGELIGAPVGDVFLAAFTAESAEPIIGSIEDIGNDQGRLAKIRFDKSGYDGTATTIHYYAAYRRDDDAPAMTAGAGRGTLLDGWTQVARVDAHGESTYGIDVPTIGDSTIAQGMYLSRFFIRAGTEDPLVFYDSPVDSGYSLDNLAPGVPANLAFAGGHLSWGPSTARDFAYYTIYGSNVDAFTSSVQINHAVATTFDATGSPFVYYFVTATDFSGNEGGPARVSALSGVGHAPGPVLSIGNYPNPFNPGTTVRYTLPSRGPVTISIFDAAGSHVRTLLRGTLRNAGTHTATWDGRSERLAPVASGVYFARVEHDGQARSARLVLIR